MVPNPLAPEADHDDVAVSVIVPAWRARHTLEACLASVLAQQLTARFEVVLVDSSNDGTVEWVRERFPAVRVLALPHRTVAGAARNAGVRTAVGRVLVFVDADCVARAGWLQALIDAQRAHGGVVGGSVAPRPPHHPVGLALHALSFASYLPGRAARHVPFVPSCNLAVGRALFLAVGGFPEEYARAQDVAFGQLIAREGGPSQFFPDAVVEHVQRTSWREGLSHQRASGYWSARLRRELPMRGTVVVRKPLLLALVVPYRFVAVAGRLASTPGYRWMAIVWLGLAPVSLSLLIAFTWGFGRGAMGAER